MAEQIGQTTIFDPPTFYGKGKRSALNITAEKLVQSGPGRVVRVSVLVAGAVGAIHDAGATGAGAAGNKIAVIPAAVGTFELDWPVDNGILVVPGAAQVVAISYS